MFANYENCVPGNNEQLSYWPILNFYSEIWRTRKKTKSAFSETSNNARALQREKNYFPNLCSHPTATATS
jgi:hypothetical protein